MDEENVCVLKITLFVMAIIKIIIIHIGYPVHRYAEGLLHARTEHSETALLVHKSTQRTMDSLQQFGPDSVLEQEVDELLAWTDALDFDK